MFRKILEGKKRKFFSHFRFFWKDHFSSDYEMKTGSRSIRFSFRIAIRFFLKKTDSG